MRRDDEAVWGALRACLGVAAVFEACAVAATQDKIVWAASPWREDPYHAIECIGLLAVPIGAAAIGVRLPARDAPGCRDRRAQMVRAAWLVLTLVAVTLGFEWAAVTAARRDAAAWGAVTWLLIGGLVCCTGVVVLAGAKLWRAADLNATGGPWELDWIDDAVLISRSLPGLRGLDRRYPSWVRQHALLVFAASSGLAGAMVTAAQTIGEHISDPLFIAWFWLVASAPLLAGCLIGNAFAGFIARPPRKRRTRIAELSMTVAGIALLLAEGFRDTIWSMFSSTQLTSVPAVVALTVGLSALSGAFTSALLLVWRFDEHPRSPNHSDQIPAR